MSTFLGSFIKLVRKWIVVSRESKLLLRFICDIKIKKFLIFLELFGL